MWFKFLLFLSILELISHGNSSKRNNVCNNFRDYYNPDDSENCYYDPDVTLETPQLIEKYAGKVEIHNVTTKDGYILTMFRIPNVNPKGVILLHHSIATYSHIYLWQGNHSIAIKLWRIGFDVWLANHRGTTYSDKHVNMTTYDFRYWDFSFHEMSMYDVTSELELIQSKTNGSKVIYMGHSLGSTIGLAYAALKPLEAKGCLKSMILLGTPAYFEHGTSLIYNMKNLLMYYMWLMDLVHVGSPLFNLPLLRSVSGVVLRRYPFILYLANLIIYAFCGYTPSQTDPKFFSYDAAIYGNNFSWKTFRHFLQMSDKKSFQMYDYGKNENLKIYGQEVPRPYHIENITVPILLVSSYNDTLTASEDSEYLYDQLSPEARIHGHWKISGLNHLDFLVGLHRKEILVDRLLDFLQPVAARQ